LRFLDEKMTERKLVVIAGFGLGDTTGLSEQYSSEGYTPLHALSAEETLRRIHQIELDGDSGALEAVLETLKSF